MPRIFFLWTGKDFPAPKLLIKVKVSPVLVEYSSGKHLIDGPRTLSGIYYLFSGVRLKITHIGLTLKCQLKRYPCCHHSFSLCYLKMLAGNSKFESEKFRIFGGKFKCKIRPNLKFLRQPKIFAPTKNFTRT